MAFFSFYTAVVLISFFSVNADVACFEQNTALAGDDCPAFWSLTPSRANEESFECSEFFKKHPALHSKQCVASVVVSIEAYDASSGFLARLSLKEENGVFFVSFPETAAHFRLKRYLAGHGNYSTEVIKPAGDDDSFTFSEVFHFYRVKIPFNALGVSTNTNEKTKSVDLFLHHNSLVGYVPPKTRSVNVHGPLGTRPLAVPARGLFFSEAVGQCSLAVKISKPPLAYSMCAVVLHFCVDLSEGSLGKAASGHFLYERGLNQKKLDLASSVVSYAKATFSPQSEIQVHLYHSRLVRTIKDAGGSQDDQSSESFAEKIRKAEQYIDSFEPGDLGQCLKKVATAEGDRQKILFVLSDGNTADQSETKKTAEKLTSDGWAIVSAGFGPAPMASILRDIAAKGNFFTEAQLYESLQSRENLLTRLCWSIKFTKASLAKIVGLYSAAVCAFVVAWFVVMGKVKLRRRVKDLSLFDGTSHRFEIEPSVDVKCADIMIND